MYKNKYKDYKAVDFLKDEDFLSIAKKRREEIENIKVRTEYRNRIEKFTNKPISTILEIGTPELYFGIDLPIA